MNERQEMNSLHDALNDELAKDFPETAKALKVEPRLTQQQVAADWVKAEYERKHGPVNRVPSGLNIKPGQDDVPPPPGRLELIDKLLSYVARNNAKIEQLEAANVKALAEAERLLAAVRGAL